MKISKLNGKGLAILVVTLIEITAIGFLVFLIHQKQSGGLISGSALDADNLNFSDDTGLRYYYEFNPDTYEEKSFLPAWLDYKPEITINSDTLNERYNYDISKPAETYRIITLGDSWTYGRYVSTKNNFSEVLEDTLNSKLQCKNIKKFEVINLGVPGYDIEYEVERFKRRGEKYQPDLVLWFFTQNDFSEINEYLSKKTNEKLANMPAYSNDHDSEPFDSTTQKPYPPKIQARLDALKDQEIEFPEEKRLAYQANLIRLFNQYFNKTLLIYSLNQVVPINNKAKQIVQDLVAERPNSSYYEGLINLQDGNSLLPDSHPNNQGHRMIAEDLYQYITERRLIPCK